MEKQSGEAAQVATGMRVKKRDGSLVPVDVNKIITRVSNCAAGLDNVDSMRIATKAISGLYDGASTIELDKLCIQTASLLTFEEPEYSKLAARLLSEFIDEEVATQEIGKFSHSVLAGNKMGLVSDKATAFVSAHARQLDRAIDHSKTDLFEYFGLRTVYDRYLLKNPNSREVIETPQYFFLRVACGLSETLEEALDFYDLISSLDYMPSSPTLFNSGTMRPQLSSCYLLDSPGDDLSDIYGKYQDVAMLSKFAGGIGLAYSRVRSRGSLIKGTNGKSNGVVPWLKTLDSSVAAVNQGGRRKGAACVYLETWHADIFEFLELRENTGDEAQRTYNLNLANWVPDLFMKRVEAGEDWSLFDPKEVPDLVDCYGEEFEARYENYEEEGKAVRTLKARDLYQRMMRTLAETGNGWMTFKDHSNKKANQTLKPENVIHLSNLCTEILEVTSDKETAVCNLGSVNLFKHVRGGEFDFEKLAKTVSTAVKYLDKVIDINFYPIESAANSNRKWRPVGLGLMGLQDVFFALKMPFDSEEAKALSTQIQEAIYFHSLKTSNEIAKENGAHPNFKETRASHGDLQYDLWGVKPSETFDWKSLKKDIKDHGLRNSLVIAIAPTATIASITGVCEATEPQISNLFKRETLSGEFLQVNRHLVKELKKINLWTEDTRTKIKMFEGSIQEITEIPENLRKVFRTVWELPQKALIDLAAARGPYIDQSQSLNLFMESPNIGKLSSMYMYAWKLGVKTTYYLRSRPATRIAKVTMGGGTTPTPEKTFTDEEALACSLENPEVCDACQ